MFREWRKILIFKMIKISLWSTEMHMHLGQNRSSHRSCYLKVGVPKNLVIFTGNPFVEYILNKVVGVSSLLIQVFSYEYCEILKQLWNNFEDHPAYDCFWLGIQTAFVFSFSKNVFYPNQTFLRLDFSLFSLRGLDEVLKRAFLNFLFTAMLY